MIRNILILLCINMAWYANGNANTNVTKILFGSCAKQDDPLPIFNAINKEGENAFIFLGDNIYGDTEDMEVLEQKYQVLAKNTGFKQLRHAMPVHAIWDDHDYGENDAGAEYPQKERSREIMLDFWQEPEDSDRRVQKAGIYTSFTIDEGDNIIRVIMPDLRWNRTPLKSVSPFYYSTIRTFANRGPYKINHDRDATMLGEAQSQWLEGELQKPAKLTILASSLQVLADFTGWESSTNYAADKQCLFNLIDKHKVNGVLIISGDTHWGELSKFSDGLAYPLWELTSSGLSEEWKHVSPNQYRVSDAISTINFGEIEVQWDTGTVILSLHNEVGETVIEQSIDIDSISPFINN